MTYKTVLRIDSVKSGAISSMSKHHMREHSVEDSHIDQERSHLNQVLIGTGNPAEDIKELASNYKFGKSNKDANENVIATEMILTANKEYFDKDFKGWRENPDALKPWIDANISFLKDNEDKLGITASAVLHLDEAAPHFHVAIVPVTDVRVKNKHTDRIEKRISHTKLYGDDMATIKEARRLGTVATATKLGRLQTLYTEHLQERGIKLERGVSNTGREHVSPEDYRNTIAQEQPEPKPLPIINKPEPASWKDGLSIIIKGNKSQIIEGYEAAAKQFRTAAMINAEDIKQRDKKINALQTENKLLRNSNEQLKKQIDNLSDIQKQTAEELKANKALMKEYREITTWDITKAKAGTWEEVQEFEKQSGRSKFNAIDFTKWKHECDFTTAVYKLSEHFPPEHIAENIAIGTYEKSLKEAIAKADEVKQTAMDGIEKANQLDTVITEKVKTPATKAKEQIIDRQTEALGKDTLYRITLMSTDKDKPTFNMGKGKGADGAEKFYNREELKELVPTLSYRNSHGYNIFITPMPDKTNRFVLLDDIRFSGKAREFEPCLVMQTSPNSRQAVYRVKGDTDEPATREFFNAINKDYGDEKISGLIHPIRLAGFTNRKPKYKDEKTGQFPFVTIEESHDIQSAKAQETIEAIQKAHDIDHAPMPEVVKAKAKIRTSGKVARLKNDDINTQNIKNWYQAQMNYWQDKTDLSKIDRRLAEHMAENGATEKQTQQAILSCSPDIDKRHGHEIKKYLSGKTNGLDFSLNVQEEREQEELDKKHEDSKYAFNAVHEQEKDFEMER